MNHLLLFAKAPRPGFVKTRLAQTLGKDQACRAYQHLLRILAAQLTSLSHTTVHHSPADAESDLRLYFPSHWKFTPQQGQDLGARLDYAITSAFNAGATKVTVIGSDCPYLTSADIHQAWSLLDQHELVVGPAPDGGYWLIALNRSQPHLFSQINWGTEQVFQQTLHRACELGLKVALLRELIDIDTEADWRAFAADSPFDLQ